MTPSTPFTSGKTLSSEEMLSLKPLIRDQPWSLYQANKEQIHGFWENLEIETSVDGNSCLAEAHKAFQFVDEIISDESLDYWKHRLAYVQLRKFLASLDAIILREKRKGHIDGRCGHRNNTIKYGILSKALEGRSSANAISLRVRWSRRWSLIIGGSMLLAIAYSDNAESQV